MAKIYDKNADKWFEVSDELYREMKRRSNRIRMRNIRHGSCSCPNNKWWVCDCDCSNCVFQIEGDTISLDAPIYEETPLADVIPSEEQPIDEMVTENLFLHQLLSRLDEIMPEARQIGEMRLEGMSDDAIAKKLHIKRTTFHSRLKKAKKQLIEEFGEIF